jgi:hypothetical protein
LAQGTKIHTVNVPFESDSPLERTHQIDNKFGKL